MKDAEQEIEKGYYWIKWPEGELWEPALYIDEGEWVALGVEHVAGPSDFPPSEIGPRIPQYTDTL